jgi:hypothetical protein
MAASACIDRSSYECESVGGAEKLLGTKIREAGNHHRPKPYDVRLTTYGEASMLNVPPPFIRNVPGLAERSEAELYPVTACLTLAGCATIHVRVN